MYKYQETRLDKKTKKLKFDLETLYNPGYYIFSSCVVAQSMYLYKI